MKKIFMVGVNNAEKADDLYWYLLNNYPRDTWDFSVKTVSDVPRYIFELTGPSERVYKEYPRI